MRKLLLWAVVDLVAGHGAMTLPPSRLSATTKLGGNCFLAEAGEAAQTGMTCFWFNEGCAIGCKSCGGLKCGHLKASEFGKCCPEQMEPTLRDKALRTYKNLFGFDVAMVHTPWRAPGFAPLYDPCGTAGGLAEGVDPGPGSNPPPRGIKQGLSMQDLPEAPGVRTEWPAGSVQDVAWGMNANHGGGYAYRLCRKRSGTRATEECFAENHLEFVGDESWIQFGDDAGNRTAFPAVRTAEGTHPPGSQWTKNPIAACGGQDGGGFPNWHGLPYHITPCRNPQFEPILKDVIRPHPKYAPEPGLYGFGMGHCTSIGLHWNGTVTPGDNGCAREEKAFWVARFGFNIIDKVKIPEGLAPGEYLLSWRWDAEQTPQVWANCADVTVTKPAAPTVV